MALIDIYDPSKVTIIYGKYAVILSVGLDPNSWIKVTRKADKYSYVPSVDGGGARLLTSDNSATIEIKLMQTSPVNRLLFAMAAEDDGSLEEMHQLTIKDNGNGGMAHQRAVNCYISKTPDSTYSDKIGSLTWQFTCSELQIIET